MRLGIQRLQALGNPASLRQIGNNKGPGYRTESLALFARMTTPPTEVRKKLINNCISRLVTSGVWAKLTSLNVLAAANSQAAYLNWRSTSYTLTETGILNTFTADRGWAGDGLTGYLDTGWSPSLGAQDSLFIAAWSRTSAQDGTGSGIIGTGTSVGMRIRTRNASDQTQATINTGTSTNIGSQTDGSGLFAANRSGATALQIYRNGTSIGTGTAASTGPSVATINIGRFATAFDASQCAALIISSSLNSTEQAVLYSALLPYMQAVGAV